KVSRVLALEKKVRPRALAKGSVTFSPKDRALIVQRGTLTTVYEMPRRYRDDVSLVSIQDPQDQHLTCVHERSYFGSRQSSSSLLQLKKTQPAATAPALLRQYWWHHISDVYLPRYINRLINQRNGCGADENDQLSHDVSMMKRLCGQWYSDEDPLPMLKQVLVLPEFQWVPQSKMEFNPVQYFLDKAKTVPNAKAVFDLLSDYCHRRAKSEQNLLFISPVAACLPTLLDPGLPEPILQLESSGGSHVEIDETKDAFREEIFAATFNMIWTDKSEPDALKDNSYQAEVSPSIFYWIKMLPFVVVYKLRPWRQKAVTCHKFPLDALDNPALSALILYKWQVDI
ncbi:hypothetical protein BGZ79_005016, partial [Entomortierella chlamydospora]